MTLRHRQFAFFSVSALAVGILAAASTAQATTSLRYHAAACHSCTSRQGVNR